MLLNELDKIFCYSVDIFRKFREKSHLEELCYIQKEAAL